MAKTVFAGNDNSQYDAGMIVKEVHDFYGQSIRTVDTATLIAGYFTHFSAFYNIDNNPTSVVYFRGTEATKTTITVNSDVAGSLNNKYFKLFTAPDNKQYHVWLNVGGLGTDPAPANSTPIEVAVDLNETAAVISFAINLTINTFFTNVFTSSRNYATIEILTAGLGITSSSLDFNTDFSITCQIGAQAEVSNVTIEYSGTSPYFNSTLLPGYYYDIYSGKFQKNPITEIENLTVSVDLEGFSSTPDSILTTGSENGTASGTKFGTVNNRRQQILATHDREQDITYADFGTKDQRITQVDYNSATFPGTIARKTIVYTLVSGRYRRDSINWSII